MNLKKKKNDTNHIIISSDENGFHKMISWIKRKIYF